MKVKGNDKLQWKVLMKVDLNVKYEKSCHQKCSCYGHQHKFAFDLETIHVQDWSWIRYRWYRYDIDKVLSISTHILMMSMSKRYRQGFVNIDTSKLWWYRRYRQISSISILSHCRWIKSPTLVAICLSTLKKRGQTSDMQTKTKRLYNSITRFPGEHFRPRNKAKRQCHVHYASIIILLYKAGLRLRNLCRLLWYG